MWRSYCSEGGRTEIRARGKIGRRAQRERLPFVVQANLLCARTRAKKVVACLTVVSLALGCAIAERYRLKPRHQAVYVTIKCIYFALYVVLPVTVMVINVLLIRDVRRAKNNILTL